MSSSKSKSGSGGSKAPPPDFRSAVTGRFVKEQYARTHPSTTVKERNKK